MAIKARIDTDKSEKKQIDEFISKGGSTSSSVENIEVEDHRLTLRIPKDLLDKLDSIRTKRTAKITRTVLILDMLEEAVSKHV